MDNGHCLYCPGQPKQWVFFPECLSEGFLDGGPISGGLFDGGFISGLFLPGGFCRGAYYRIP